MAAKYVLGATTHQMNKNHDFGDVVDNQLRTWEHLGLFTEPLPKRPDELPRVSDYRDESIDLGTRARSYLHANCSHCHRKWGGGNAEFQLLATLELDDLGIVGVRPGQGTFQILQAQLLTPGDPHRSVLFYRMAKTGSGHMPRIGSAVTDPSGLHLIHDWIASLAPEKDSGTKVIEKVASLRKPNVNAMTDQLLSTTNTASALAWAVAVNKVPAVVRDDVIARGVAHAQPEVRDLFERFLPEEKRTKRLGSVIKTAEILAIPGDPARGKQLFLNTEGVQCKNCHRIAGKGTELGPDLSEIGKKYQRAQLLETIIQPSKEIEPKFATYLVETKQGKTYSGLLVERDQVEVILKDAQNKSTRIPAGDVDLIVPQQKSMMPELLLRDMTAQDVADLTAYLSGLK